MAHRPTTTTYALLGMLALDAFSAYELTKYMRRGALAQLWPRTEAAIYRETRALAESGLASATVESRQGRDRTVYRITPAGQRALQAWLEEPSAGLSFECEAALKAFLVDDVSTIRDHLVGLATSAEQAKTDMSHAASDWAQEHLIFPHRLHYTAMAADLVERLHRAAGDWAEDWLHHIEDWNNFDLDDHKDQLSKVILESLANGRT